MQQQQDAAAADHVHEQLAHVHAAAGTAHRDAGDRQRVDDAELHQRDHRRHIALRGRGHRGGEGHRREEGGRGHRAVVRRQRRGVADVEAAQAPRDQVDDARDREGHEQGHADQRQHRPHLGLGQLAAAGDAQREQQVDREQLDHRLGQLELALHEAGHGTEQEREHDGLEQVGQQQVDAGHGVPRRGLDRWRRRSPGGRMARILGRRLASFQLIVLSISFDEVKR